MVVSVPASAGRSEPGAHRRPAFFFRAPGGAAPPSRLPWARAGIPLRCVGAAVLLFVAGLPAAMAQGEPAPDVLTPRRFVQLAVDRNAEIAYARLQSRIADRGFVAESTLYQPVSFTSVRHESRYRQRTAEEQLATLSARTSVLDEMVNTAETGLRMRAATGAEITTSVQRSLKRSNLIASLYNDGDDREASAQLVVTVRQPLLKGRGTDAVEADLRVAELEREVGQWTLRQQLLKMSSDALVVYWQLQRAYRSQPVRQRLLENAREALDDARERIGAGRVAMTVEDEARALLSMRESELLRNAQLIAEAEGRIRTILDLPPGDGAWKLFDTAPAAMATSAEVSSPTAWESRVDQWPAYQIASLRVRQNQHRLDFARNQTLPQLDLQANWGSHGLGRNPRAAAQPVPHNRYPDWYVGLYFEQPLGGTTRPDAQYEGQQLKLQQAELEARNARVSFGNDWQARLLTLQLAQRDADQLRADLKSRVELLRADETGLRDQLVPRARVLRREAEKLESELRLIEGEARLWTALTQFQQADGQLLPAYGVELAWQ